MCSNLTGCGSPEDSGDLINWWAAPQKAIVVGLGPCGRLSGWSLYGRVMKGMLMMLKDSAWSVDQAQHVEDAAWKMWGRNRGTCDPGQLWRSPVQYTGQPLCVVCSAPGRSQPSGMCLYSASDSRSMSSSTSTTVLPPLAVLEPPLSACDLLYTAQARAARCRAELSLSLSLSQAAWGANVRDLL